MKYLFLALIFTGLYSCGSNSSDENGLENNFHIEGKISGAARQKIKIEAQAQSGVITVAETTTDATGKYSLDGNIPGMGIYSMTVGSDARNAIAITLEEKDHAVINGNMETFSFDPKISGTRWSKPLMKYMKLFNEFAKAQMEQTMKETDLDKQIALFEQLQQPLMTYVQTQILKEPGNPVNIILCNSLMPNSETGLSNWNPENLPILKKMAQAFQKEHAASPITNMLNDQIAFVESEYENYRQFSSGELSAPEISLPNPDGKELKLSSLKGKVVLVDFWASWCAPCRKENPNVVRLYKKYQSKGFEIFSVSLDQDPAAWKAAIKKDGLSWPNHVSDLLGWQTPLTQQYGFQSIPYTVLLSKEGKIIGVGLRGAKLEQKLLEALSK